MNFLVKLAWTCQFHRAYLTTSVCNLLYRGRERKGGSAEGDACVCCRVWMVNRGGEVVAVTEEFNIGSGAAVSCAGEAGVPVGVEQTYVGGNSATFRWRRPSCDEQFGPIEGYEYILWNVQDNPPARPSQTPQTQVTMNRLAENTRYAFKVRSRSRGGRSPWSEITHATTSSTSIVAEGGRNDGNIYHLRIVLAPPKSFLVWTPLPQHNGRIRRFKLSYKVSAEDGSWTRIEDTPSRFQCPAGIGNPGDFCYDLNDLQYGTQYTSDLIYRLDTGEWSRSGNPLFFILVEAGLHLLRILSSSSSLLLPPLLSLNSVA